MKTLHSLQRLNLLQTPLSDEKADGIKKEVLLAIEGHKFKLINKDEVLKEDYEDSVALKEQRWQEEEEKRREEEEKWREEEEARKVEEEWIRQE